MAPTGAQGVTICVCSCRIDSTVSVRLSVRLCQSVLSSSFFVVMQPSNSLQAVNKPSSSCSLRQDGQGTEDDDTTLVPTTAAARWRRHLCSSPEAALAADGVPVQHASRLLSCQCSNQDQSITSEHTVTLSRSVLNSDFSILLPRIIASYPIMTPLWM